MKRLAHWYLRQSGSVRVASQAAAAASAGYGAALLGAVVQEALELDDLLSATVVLALLGLAVVTVCWFSVLLRGYVLATQSERVRVVRAEGAAREAAERRVLEEIARLTTTVGSTPGETRTPADPVVAMKHIVKSAHDTLQQQFGDEHRPHEQTRFEVTFITKSYADGELTIAASANRDHQVPVTMQKRASDPKVLNGSVADGIYRRGAPYLLVLTEDTSSEDYNELYGGQKNRIKSSVVVPVEDARHVLLGCLVMHCDRAGFFRRADEKRWRDFATIFTRPLALEKLRLDHATDDQGRSPERWLTPPF